MGRRGPAPEPVKLKLLKGETRPSRVNRKAPEPRANRPVMAADMDVAAQTVWKRVMRELGETGIITAADTDVLRCYSEAVARYEEAARMLARSSPLVRGARGNDLVRNPLHQVVRDNADLVKLFARELGLSPAARVSLTVPGGAQDDALDTFARTRTG